MKTARLPARFPILTFTIVGFVLFITNSALIRGVMSLSTGPHGGVAVILAELVNLIGPGLWLLTVAFCVLLTAGKTTPSWTHGHWLWALIVLYVFYIPHIFVPPTIFGRWGYVLFLCLGALGAVLALRLLFGRFHVAALLFVAEPLVRVATQKQLAHGARTMTLAFFSVVSWALVGWWFRDKVVCGS